MKTFKHQSPRSGTPLSPGNSSSVFTETNPKLLISWQQILSKSQTDRSRPGWRVAQFLELIEVHYKKQRSVRFYAKQLFIHKDYLRQACKKVLKLPPSHCIQCRVVLEAAPMIREGKLMIGEVALQMGFNDHSHFDRIFIKHIGLTPTEFRKQSSEKC